MTDGSEFDESTLVSAWRRLAQHNNWELVQDEVTFLKEAAVEWQELSDVKTEESRVELAVRRAYAARLTEALRKNVEQSWKELALAFLRVALRDNISRDDAEELAQAALVRVFEKLPSLRLPQSLFPYVFRILRTVRRERWAAGTETKADSLDDIGPAHEVASNDDVQTQVEDSILVEDVRTLLAAALPKQIEFEVVWRTAVLEQKPRYVAHALNLSLPQARLHKSRGLARLRENAELYNKLHELLSLDQEIGNDNG